MGFDTPEEAARQGTPAEYVRVVGVVVRGDEAIVAQITNADGYPDSYEIETVQCYRDGDGWEAGSSSNGDASFIPTGVYEGTVVTWLVGAPDDAVAAVFAHEGREVEFPVENGCVVSVFDGVPMPTTLPDSYPKLINWVRSS